MPPTPEQPTPTPPPAPAQPASSPKTSGKLIKAVRIFLLVLIIIGLGLIATEKLWVPKLVTVILENPILAVNSTVSLSSLPSTATSTSTYTNTQYGFNFQYPRELMPVEESSDQIVFTIPGPYNMATSTLIVRVGTASESPQFITNCMTYIPKSTQDLVVSDVGTTTINGIVFLSYRLTNGNAYIHLLRNVYTTVKDNNCYSISNLIATTPNNADSTNQFMSEDVQAVEAETDKIIQSFRFAQ